MVQLIFWLSLGHLAWNGAQICRRLIQAKLVEELVEWLPKIELDLNLLASFLIRWGSYILLNRDNVGWGGWLPWVPISETFRLYDVLNRIRWPVDLSFLLRGFWWVFGIVAYDLLSDFCKDWGILRFYKAEIWAGGLLVTLDCWRDWEALVEGDRLRLQVRWVYILYILLHLRRWFLHLISLQLREWIRPEGIL